MDQVTFADVLQKSFVAMSMGSTDRITTLNILLNISMSFMIGMFIFFIYKKTFQGVLYQKSFNISLVLASIVTSLVIMTISGNLILSLGMVGALSIVRFRTPIKDSMDLIFLFWAISVGIANGVSYYNISIVGSIMIALFLMLLTRTSNSGKNAYILVIQAANTQVESSIYEILDKEVDNYTVKSKVMTESSNDITVEINSSKGGMEFMERINKLEGVHRLSLVAYDQDLSAV